MVGLLPQLFVLGTGLLILVMHILGRKSGTLYLGLCGLLVALVACVVAPTGTGYLLHLDEFSRGATGLVFLAALLVLGLSPDYLGHHDLSPNEWTFLLLSGALGLSLMYSSYHLFVLFLGLELSSLSFYVLCGYRRNHPKSLEASLKYFVLGSVGSAVLLLGIALLFISQRTVVVTEFLRAGGIKGLSAGLIVIMIGLLFKLSLVPLHIWVPDVYEGAPTPITAFMSVAVKVGILGVMVRLFYDVGLTGVIDWSRVFWWFAAATMIVGNLVALVQENVKRMLAYSSIAHAGYLTVGLVALSDSGFSAVAFYVAVYAGMTIPAFGITMLAAESRGGDYSYETLQGLSESRPLFAAALAMCMVSLSGLPPTAGFMGKLLLFQSAVEAGYAGLAVIAVLASVVSVGYYFRVIVHAYMRGPEGDRVAPTFRRNVLAATSTLLPAVLLLVLGVLPGWLYGVTWELLSDLA